MTVRIIKSTMVNVRLALRYFEMCSKSIVCKTCMNCLPTVFTKMNRFAVNHIQISVLNLTGFISKQTDLKTLK